MSVHKPPAKVQDIKIHGYSLLNIRLCWYSVAFIHIMVAAVVTLSIDVTVDEDPRVRAYSHIRWKLITFVFNVVTLFYLPLCLYCDMRRYYGHVPPHVEQLRFLLDEVMTVFLVPVTTFSDVTFWILYFKNPDIINPRRLLDYLPYWAQHSLHTVSMVTVIMDLILTPRRRPDNLKKRLAILLGVATLYCIVVYVSKLNGEYVYAILETASLSLELSMFLGFVLTLSGVYYAQWYIIDFVWGQNLHKKHKVNKGK